MTSGGGSFDLTTPTGSGTVGGSDLNLMNESDIFDLQRPIVDNYGAYEGGHLRYCTFAGIWNER